MKHADHFLLTEAWRRADELGEEARREQLLAPYRAARTASWRRRAARLLVRLAGRLEPRQTAPYRPCSGLSD